MKTTRPCQIVYLNFFSSNIKDSIAFTFYAIDDFSEYAFLLDVTELLDGHIVLEQIKMLVAHEHFNTSLPFTIMAVAGIEMEKDIRDFLKPLDGSIIFDRNTVIKKTRNFIAELNRFEG